MTQQENKEIKEYVIEIAKNAKKASSALLNLRTEQKNKILLDIAKELDKNRKTIIEENKKDVINAKKNNLKESLIDRLILNDKRINGIIGSLRVLAGQKDYVGEIITKKTLKNGLILIEKRVPFGVIAAIFESRPNVSVDIGAISLKSSSATILRGGKEAINTNKILIKIMSGAIPVENAVQLIENTDRQVVNELLKLRDYIDLIIPRGGEGLINFVRENSKIPVIETGIGNCHIYLDKEYDEKIVMPIILNAKTQRVSVCNAAEKLLVHKDVPPKMIKKIASALKEKGVEIRADERIRKIIDAVPATEFDWPREYLDYIIAIKMVDNIDEAINHINRYGTKHSEAIISTNKNNIERFFNEVDAAVVYSNASTRFTDGYEFGMGAEIGISTQKLHARGPMALKALTTTKYIVVGNGQIRE